MKEPEWIKMINYSQEIRLFSHLLNRRGKPKNVLTKLPLLLSANEWVYQNH